MRRKASRTLPGTKPLDDKKRGGRDVTIEDADENNDQGRDLARGEGGTLDMPVKPGDLSRDD